MAHALMARFYGLPVRRIVLFIFGGVAEIEREPRKAHQEFWIAFIGPLSSVALGVLLLLGSWLLGGGLPGEALSWLGQINLALAAFNMLPGFPLDGGRVLRAVLWFLTGNHLRSTIIAARVGQLFAGGFMLLGMVQWFLTGNLFASFWTVFVGWFLWSAASGHLQLARTEGALADITLEHAIQHRLKLNWDWSLVYALDMMSLHGVRYSAPVMRDNELVGMFALEAVARVPRLNWGTVRVANLMRPVQGVPTVSIRSDLLETLRFMDAENADFIIVRDEQAPERVSVLDRHELLMFAERRRRAALAA
ncbi:MAG: hypothetical protein HC915_05675 [Anaerolineae bacterium]|nr:hypothetical protein [Anaerolineae bacterium]